MSEHPQRGGRLYLVPVGLGGEDVTRLLPERTLEIVRRLETFIVENARSARRFLGAIGHPRPLRELRYHVLDEHGDERGIEAALEPLLAGEDCGLLSEAGCPAVADPGAALVDRAHRCGARVIPLVGPSAILLALMASGLDGQHFEFHGYLPVDAARRADRIREIETRARGASQIFIETPYRSAAMLEALLEHCRADTRLCIAADLTLPGEFVRTRRVAEWKSSRPDLLRRPAVFLLWRGDRRRPRRL